MKFAGALLFLSLCMMLFGLWLYDHAVLPRLDCVMAFHMYCFPRLFFLDAWTEGFVALGILNSQGKII